MKREPPFTITDEWIMGKAKTNLSDSLGFTLLELILATAIALLVIGILSVCLSFSLRVWEREQNRKQSDMPKIVDLLKWQLGTFDPVFFTIDGKPRLIFEGSATSLSFTTDYSVKALSKGVPVIARYVFNSKAQKIYYAEMPLNPYDTDALKEFLKRKPRDDDKGNPPFFSVSVASFALTYAGGDDKERYGETWEDDSSIPAVVLVKWVTEEGAPPFSNFVMPNFMFARPLDKTNIQLQPSNQ